MRNRSSKIRPVRTTPASRARPARGPRDGSESSQPLPRNSSTVCPVIQRHSAESSSISPVGDATQMIWAPPWTRARYRSSLRRSASSVPGPVPPAMTMRPAPYSSPSGVVHPEPVEGPLARHALPARPRRSRTSRWPGCPWRTPAAARPRLARRPPREAPRRRAAAEIAHRAAVHARERRVGPDEAQIGVEERHPGRRVAQHGVGQPGFKLAQSGLPLLRHGGVRTQPSTSPTMQAPATGGSFLLPRCQKTPPTWRLAAARRRRGMAPPPQRSLRIRVPQSRDRCCQLAAGKPSPHRR